MSYSPTVSSALHAQASLASSINVSRASGSSSILNAETNLASASVQDGAWVAEVETLLAPPIVSVDLSSAAQKLMSDGPSSAAIGTLAAASTGSVFSTTV
ncbi:MAG: hypothetical protein ACYDD1_04190 [Caulobacteraceae bacterium]